MNTKLLIEFFLLNAFILEILSVSISSYNLRSFIIKLASLTLLYILIFIHYKVQKPDLSSHLNSSNFKKLLYTLLFLLLIFLLSLTYSENPYYGSLKILNFSIGTIPAVLAFYYLIITFNEVRYKIFFTALFVEIVLLIAAITLMKPFSYDGSTPITLTQWSHVIYGHFTAPVYILFLLALLNTKKKKQIAFFAAGALICFYGTYISGLKSAFYGASLFTAIILIVYLFKKLLSVKSFLIIASVILLSIILMVLTSDKELIQRFNIFDPDFDVVSSTVRLEALKISWDIFDHNPLIGMGFGGFKISGTPLAQNVNYPHNIFAEFGVELGITGLLIFTYVLYLIFSSTQRISFNVTIFFCFALWFALFSKDIPSNVILWLGLAYIGVKEKRFSIS